MRDTKAQPGAFPFCFGGEKEVKDGTQDVTPDASA